MANEEHVALLRKGVAIWNEWRRSTPESKPDLSRVDLNQADLIGANLCQADLSYANLSHADLSRLRKNSAFGENRPEVSSKPEIRSS